MADFRKLGKGAIGALGKLNEIAAAQREANLAKFLEPSKVQQRLYHGTTATEGGKGTEAIRRLKPSKEGALGSGVYLTPSTAHASSYSGIPNDEALALMRGTDYGKMSDQFMADRASGTLREGQAGGNMLPVHAQLKNPLIIEGTHADPMIEALMKLGMDEDKAARMVEKAYEDKGYIGKQVQSRAQAKGHDGLMQYRDGELSEVVAYNPNTVKSAIGNEGTYDIYNPDLSKAVGGGVHMVDGGKMAKGMVGALSKLNEIAKARRVAEMAPTARIGLPAPGILIPSNLNNVREAVRNIKGNYGARRVERAADEIPNLEKMFQEDALKEAFTGDNARGVMTMNPADFEKYATPLIARTKSWPGSKAEKENLPTDEYIKYLQQIGGFSDVPYLNLFKDEVGLPTKASIVGHEGRHRNRALADQGEKASLVQLSPRGDLREGMPRRTQEDFIEALKEELDSANRLVLPEKMFLDDGSLGFDNPIMRKAIQIPDIYAEGGGVKHMAKAGKVGAAAEGIVGGLNKLNEIAKARKAASESKMADVLENKTAPMTTPQGTGLPLMPRDNGMYTLREQKELPRMLMVDKARAAGVQPNYNERMQDLLDSPKARKKVDNLINKGKALGVQEWYGTEPLRQVTLNAGRTPEQFDSMMAQFASASQRNPVDKQNQMGSYLYYLSETGQLPADSLLLTNKLKEALKADPSLAQGRTLVELPKGYGSLAQGDIFNRAVMIGQGDIAGALPPNKKLGTFYENLLGNVKPVTVDVNALRGPIIEQGDPRWLTSKLVEKDDKGKVINTYKPREMYNSGEMSMREAQQRPGFWEAAPSGSEYAGFEDLWTRGAKRHDIEPAEAQALGWYGSADVTALKTKPENYVDNLERLIRQTAEQTGKSPTEVLNDMVTGQGFLRKKGGVISKPNWHLAVEKRMKDGGHIMIDPKHIPRVRSLKHMAKGGEAKDDSASLKELYEALPDFYDQAIKPEVESYKKPRAFTDLLNRGVIANNPVSAVVDLTNFGLSGIDALTKGTRIPTRFSSEKPFGGSEQIKDLMKEYGMTTHEERPIAETLLGFLSPGSLVGGTVKGASAIKKAGTAMKDMATSKKARGGLTLMR